MIYVTGDVHCPIDVSKLNMRNFEAQKCMTKEDYLIVCGDFGIVWDCSKEDEYWQDWFEERNYTTLFVEGNHENHVELAKYPVEMWNGGKIHRIRPSVIHLMRGQVYNIDGSTFFTMGGASSTDRHLRTENVDWWKEELPSEEEYAEAEKNLKKHDYKVDYIITHTVADNIMYRLKPTYKQDPLTNYFFELDKKIEFKKWYFGHFHEDREIDEKHRVLYYDKIKIEKTDK